MTMIDNQYKLVLGVQKVDKLGIELYDLMKDPAENHNLVNENPSIAEKMQNQMHDWQQSVLESLTGADYK